MLSDGGCQQLCEGGRYIPGVVAASRYVEGDNERSEGGSCLQVSGGG